MCTTKERKQVKQEVSLDELCRQAVEQSKRLEDKKVQIEENTKFRLKQSCTSKEKAWNFEGTVELYTDSIDSIQYCVNAFKHGVHYLFEGYIAVHQDKTLKIISGECYTITKSGKKRRYSSFFSVKANLSSPYLSRATRLFLESVKPELELSGGVFFNHRLKETFDLNQEYNKVIHQLDCLFELFEQTKLLKKKLSKSIELVG